MGSNAGPVMTGGRATDLHRPDQNGPSPGTLLAMVNTAFHLSRHGARFCFFRFCLPFPGTHVIEIHENDCWSRIGVMYGSCRFWTRHH